MDGQGLPESREDVLGGSDRVLAIDLGGTNLRAAVVASDGDLQHRRAVPTPSSGGPTAVIDQMALLIEDVAAAATLPPSAPVGVTAPGPLNPRAGVVRFAPNLPDWQDVPLRDLLAAASHRPVAIGNDGNCAALGEARFGAGKGYADLVYLALGTGVGGGVISGGRLVDGMHGLGAELGHVVVALDGPRCSCGAIGCLEAFVGGWAIAREGRLVASTVDGAAMLKEAGDRSITASVVAAAARGGDPAALAILGRAGRALGAAMGAFVNIFNPALIVVGGGVAALGDLLLAPARSAFPSHCFPASREHVAIVQSLLGDDTGLYGAAAVALDLQENIQR